MSNSKETVKSAVMYAAGAVVVAASAYALYQSLTRRDSPAPREREEGRTPREREEGRTEEKTDTKTESKASKDSRKYHFYRKDFGPLPLMPLHYDLIFDMDSSRVRVVSRQTYMYFGDKPTTTIELNSHDVDVEKVQMFRMHDRLGAPPKGLDSSKRGPARDFVRHVASLKDAVDVQFEDLRDDRKVRVTLPSAIKKGDEVVLRIVSECHPNEKMLEGIYFDYTPEGCPQTMITQCQQYGFQRIVPCVDRMASKTYYTTTIIADERYTNVVTNGDLADGFYDPETSKPIYHAPIDVVGECWEDLSRGAGDAPRHAIKYYNHKVNMAPYLFFLGCGTYDSYQRRVEYPDGDTFIMELLCLPGVAEPVHAAAALDALHDSVLYVYLDCGPEATLHSLERAMIYDLIQEREVLKKEGPGSEDKLSSTRAELKRLIGKWKETGYKYTGQIYREIAMENSNYGGMENVGNTTILSSRLTPSKWLTDPGYVYMEGVKVHEYYHNINGSQVTGQSPFEIWLNEAVTVHIQRKRQAFLFGHDYMRLRHVIYAKTPSTGPLAADRSPVSLAVEPEGFNTTHELISAMTYSKAPEFVRMCELILGQQRFDRALENYHQKYAYANATTDNWIQEMCDLMPVNAQGRAEVDLHEMATGWLRRTGYPTLRIKSIDYNASASTVTIQLAQTGFEEHSKEQRYPWIIPVDFAVVANGRNIREGVFLLRKANDTLVVKGVSEKPSFVSFARDWSFFGDVLNEAATEDMMTEQALSDPDSVNRFLAYRAIAEAEKANIIESLVQSSSNAPVVGDTWLKLYGKIMNDQAMSMSTKALFLSESESIPTRPDLGHRYQEIADARAVMLKGVWNRYSVEVVANFKTAKEEGSSSPHSQKDNLAARSFMRIMLATIKVGVKGGDKNEAGLTTPEFREAIAELLNQSAFMSDKVSGLAAVLSSPEEVLSKQSRKELQEMTKAEWTKHPIGCEQYISTVATVDSDDCVELVSQLLKEPFFKMSLAGHARTVARGWSANRKRALLTDDGLDFTVKLFHEVGKVNQMSAYSIIACFGDLAKFDQRNQTRLVGALKRMQDGLDAKEHQSLYNQLAILLKNY